MSLNEYWKNGVKGSPDSHGEEHHARQGSREDLLDLLSEVLGEEGGDESQQGVSSHHVGIAPIKNGKTYLSPIKGFKSYLNPAAAEEIGAHDDESTEPGWLESAARLAVFNGLTKPGRKLVLSGGPHYVPVASKADRAQQVLIDQARKLVHDQTPILIPDEIHVKAITDDLSHDLSRVPLSQDEIIPDPSKFEAEVDKHARKLTRAIYAERSPDDTPATAEERAVAKELWVMRHMTKPEQRRKLLEQRVFDRAEDVAVKQKVSSLLSKIRSVQEIYNRVVNRPPKAWLVNDFLTSEIVLSPEEQKALETVLWGMNGKDFWIRDIKGHRDVVTIPLAKFVTKQQDGLILTIDQPEYYDRVVKPLGRFRPIADRFISPTSVGRIKIESLGRDKILGQFTVRDAGKAKQHILDLAKKAGEVSSTIETISSHVREQDADNRFIIRPQKVIGMLPDPTIMHFDPVENTTHVENTRRTIDEIFSIWKQGAQLKQALEHTKYWANGRPTRAGDAAAFKFWTERQNAARERYQRLTGRSFTDDLNDGKIRPS